jgi:phosphatidylglycerol---prolipoprotein diacylglyceryl transferase
MYPHLFSLGPIHVHAYGFMMAMGFAAGLLHWIWLGRARGYSRATCTDLMILVMVSGILGGRLAFVFENLDRFLARPQEIVRLDQGGLVFYGGLVLSAFAVLLFARRRKLAFIPLVDFTLTAVPLSHAFGRIGCFLNSCCYGVRCTAAGCGLAFPKFSLPWHAHYEAGLIGPQAPASLPVHPVQLYEAGFNLVVYVLLLWLYRGNKRAGLVAAAYLVLYACGRFLLEFLRGDHGERAGLAGLSVGQLVSLPLFGVGLVVLGILLFRAHPAGKERGPGQP